MTIYGKQLGILIKSCQLKSRARKSSGGGCFIDYPLQENVSVKITGCPMTGAKTQFELYSFRRLYFIILICKPLRLMPIILAAFVTFEPDSSRQLIII